MESGPFTRNISRLPPQYAVCRLFVARRIYFIYTGSRVKKVYEATPNRYKDRNLIMLSRNMGE
jgi:hypothetical protein